MKITLGKISSEYFVEWAIMMFPLVNIFVAFFNKGDGLFSLYVLYSVMIFAYAAFNNCRDGKIITDKVSIFLVLILALEGFFSYVIANGKSFLNDYILYSFCVIFWILFADNNRLLKFEDFFWKNKTGLQIFECVYYIILFLSVINGTGIDKEGWGTVTLKGPYGVNHLLAYELTFFLVINIIYWMRKNTFFSTVLIILNLVLILLTGVRGGLIAVAFVLLFAFCVQKTKKQMILVIVGSLLLAFLLFKTNIFDILIEKTNHAISHGSVTNGRGKIFVSSIKAYLDSDSILMWFVGIGHEALLAFNRQNIRLAIHAHNDIIDALVQYGLIGLGVYISSLKKFFIRETKIYWPALIIFGCLAGFNGYYMYQSGVILSPILLIYTRVLYNTKCCKG